MWLGKEKKYARFSLRTRNRTIILLGHYAMLHVSDVATLFYYDVLEADG
jgi:hypothetical protein